jgi:hypothetical protein
LDRQKEHQIYAAERAKLLFGSYRKGDANDPETYVAAIASILAEYSIEVIQRVTDPRTGYARTHKFMPNPCDISECCDEAKAFLVHEKIAAEKGWHWNGEKWENNQQ